MLYFLLFFAGACFGSFINVIACRLPQGISFINGRSRCPFCVKEIAPYDLIPLLSFFILKRRCRNCSAKISWQYLLIEILSGLIFVISFWLLPGINIFYWLCFVALVECLIILAIIDSQYLILPNSLLLTIGIIWLAVSIFDSGFNPAEFAKFSVVGFGWAVVVFFVPFLIWSFSNGKWIGLGDAKLAGLLALVFGITNTIYIFYLAVILGSLIGLVMLISRKGGPKTQLPLGTFICLSAVFFMFWGFGIAESVTLFLRHLIVNLGMV